MTKLDVVNKIRKQTGIDPKIGRAVIEAFCGLVKLAVAQGDTVYIRTFGSFGPKHRGAKVARNISQNTALPIEAHTIPFFKPSREFTDQVRMQKVPISTKKAKV